jgi:hypothetical protein
MAIKTYRLGANQVRFKVSDISLDLADNETVDLDYNSPLLHPNVKSAIDNGILVEFFGSYSADKPSSTELWRDDFNNTLDTSVWKNLHNSGTFNKTVEKSLLKLSAVSTPEKIFGVLRLAPTSGTWTVITKFFAKKNSESFQDSSQAIKCGLIAVQAATLPSSSITNGVRLGIMGQSIENQIIEIADINTNFANAVAVSFSYNESLNNSRAVYLKIYFDGTNLNYYYSTDGIGWNFITNDGNDLNSLLTPTWIGLFCSSVDLESACFDYIACHSGFVDIIGG